MKMLFITEVNIFYLCLGVLLMILGRSEEALKDYD